MIKQGYGDKRTIQRRIESMEEWISNPTLMEADEGAHYECIIDIDMNEINEPILCAPNDPDDAVLLSEVAGENIDEVFIGSCMTNIGHFRATGELLNNHNSESLKSKLWIAPPTKMDESILKEEGFYDTFQKANVQLEMPGCSLCMGNQARVQDNATVLSTSTRNFPNRLGKGANVYLASAELSAITALNGKIPTLEELIQSQGPGVYIISSCRVIIGEATDVPELAERALIAARQISNQGFDLNLQLHIPFHHLDVLVY